MSSLGSADKRLETMYGRMRLPAGLQLPGMVVTPQSSLAKAKPTSREMSREGRQESLEQVGRRGSRQNAICGIYTMRVGARRQPLGEAVTYGALDAR